MQKRKRCIICRKLFWPDTRVGERQRACSRPECQKARRARTQTSWRRRNPDYLLAWRLRERSAQADRADAARARGLGKGEPLLRRPPPLRMPGALRRIPWDVMQDEAGVPTTDFVAVVALLLVALVKDQRRSYSTENREDPSRLPGAAGKDQKTDHPTDSNGDLPHLLDHAAQDQMRAMRP